MRRSKFSLSHFKEFTCDMGKLIPIAVIDALPGDTFVHSSNILIRMSPMLAPVMHPIVCRIHHWFVPYRLIWEEFEDFITGGVSGYGIDTPSFPTINISCSVGSLADYMGLPISDEPLEVSALPFRAYNLIYNNFYRDQDLQQELPISYGSSLDSETVTDLVNICWQKDYFTTSRPWTQKGAEVTIPINGAAPQGVYAVAEISGISPSGFNNVSSSWSSLYNAYLPSVVNPLLAGKRVGDKISMPLIPGAAGGTVAPSGDYIMGEGTINNISDRVGSPPLNPVLNFVANGYVNKPWSISLAYSDLSGGSFSVLDLRKALAIQRFEEKRSSYGSRYVEYLSAAFGVRPRDARLQLPEYLGGGKQLLRINEVLQTAQGSDPVGTLRGQGTGLIGSNRYKRFIPEHGVIISLLSVLPETMYTQGLKRMWLKRTPTDFFMREFSSVGVQEVYSQELYGKASPGKVFGYQDRYDEYRHEQSSVSGEFRDTLDFWNLSRQFGNEPVLNGSFVECNPSKRIFASQDTDSLWCLCNHSIRARRVVPKRAPTLIK